VVAAEEAKEFLQQYAYDAVFLDHDLLPHHYESNDHDDFASTGYATRSASRPAENSSE